MTRLASIHVLGSTLERVSFCVYEAHRDRNNGLNAFNESVDRFIEQLLEKKERSEEASLEDVSKLMSRVEEHVATFLLVEQSPWTSVFSEYLECGHSRTRAHALAWFAWWYWRGKRTRFKEPVMTFEFSDDPGAEFVDLALIRSGKVVTALTAGPGVSKAGLKSSALDAGVAAAFLHVPVEGLTTLHASASLQTMCLYAAEVTGLPLTLNTRDVVKDAERLRPEEYVLEV
jgi:hypothetical protein